MVLWYYVLMIPGVREIIPDLKGKIKIITYGFSPQADYQAKNVVSAGFQSHFTVVKQARVCGKLFKYAG